MRSAYEQNDCKLVRKSKRETKECKEEKERERKRKSERENRAEATGPLIISITYANLRGETGLDAIRSNYFTLAKRLLLVAELIQRRRGIAESPGDMRKRDQMMGYEISGGHGYEDARHIRASSAQSVLLVIKDQFC